MQQRFLMVPRDHDLARLTTALEEVSLVILTGIAGVGKTSLAGELLAAWSGPATYMSATTVACAALGDPTPRPPGELGAPACERIIEDACARLDRIGGLVVLDDFHELDEIDQHRIIDTAARLLVTGRLVIATRERLAMAADRRDCLQIRLDGLDRASAELLWKRLHELCGESPDFESAWQHVQGNPLALRRAHAGLPREHHPLADALHRLDDAERRVLEVIASSDEPVAASALAELVPSGDLEAILAGLHARMFVDATRRAYTMDRFVRAVVRAHLEPRTDDTAADPGDRTPIAMAVPSGLLRRTVVAAPLVIDGPRNELRQGARWISLHARFVLRRLLYMFASTPGHRLTREVIARTLWAVDYDPRRHESSLKSNIRRLRHLLAGTDATIETTEDGYRLRLPPEAVFVPPDD
ncbi:MAG TPA: winged helix-turn-helix domain-containing protein [Kofleriaceae bacterium]|nr:winged helix-turn-helix domain-containing protein [Kofleriaceae bacterium]